MAHSIHKEGYTAHFNSDLSGEIEFVEYDGAPPSLCMRVPASLVLAVVARYVRGEAIEKLECATDLEILVGKKGKK
jgi:hypothetical protein